MNKYWLGTEINTQLVFLSDGGKINNLCYWNYYNNTGQVIIRECNNDTIGYLQVSHNIQIFVNFRENGNSNPNLVFKYYEKDRHSGDSGFNSYSDYVVHLIDKMIDQADQNKRNWVNTDHTVMKNAESTTVHRYRIVHSPLHQVDTHSDVVTHDFHDPGVLELSLQHGHDLSCVSLQILHEVN